MKGLARGVFVIALSFALGKVVQIALGSSIGQKAALKVGYPELASPKTIGLLQRYARQAAQLVAARFFVEAEVAPKIAETRAAVRPDWTAALADASEMLVSLGVVLRALTEFAKQDQRLSKQIAQTERAA